MKIATPDQRQPNSEIVEITNDLENPYVGESPYGPMAAACDIGPSKSENHDRVSLIDNREKGIYAAVGLDGMGGDPDDPRYAHLYQHANKAANVGAKIMSQSLAGGQYPEEAHHAAHEALIKAKVEENGFTSCAVKFEENKLHYALAGDVQLVVIGKDGKVSHTTTPQHMLPPDHDTVTNCVTGEDYEQEVETGTFELQEGDTVLLVTDGIADNYMPEEVETYIAELRRQRKSEDEIAKLLANTVAQNMADAIAGAQDPAEAIQILGRKTDLKEDNRGAGCWDIDHLPES